MKLLIIRHGDPDYSINSLTEKGWREAELLAERLTKLDVKEFYVSPSGRAKDTAACTLNKINREGIESEWLREMRTRINRPDLTEKKTVVWDWLPQDWMTEEKYFHYDSWADTEIMRDSGVKKEYDWIISSLDEILAEHGYRREEKYYRVERENSDTLVFFCHFGLECALLSHLLNISPMVLWHAFSVTPTSVTTVVTEERRQGIASFRMLSFGDISHLDANDEPPAFAGRFCETYGNAEEPHD